MIRAFRSEWVKLRRPRMLLGGLGALIVVAVLLTTISILSAGQPTSRSGLTVAELAGADGLAKALEGSGAILGAVGLSIAAASVAGEFTQGTLRVLLVRQPRRLSLVAGKYLALLSFIALGVALAVGVSAVGGLLAASARSISTSAWWRGAGLSATTRTGINLILAASGYTLVGATLALLVRSPAAAIGAGLGWLLPIEQILAAAADGIDRILPGQLLNTIASGGNSTATYLAAAATLAAYALVTVPAAAIVFARRDVTT